MAGEAGLLSYLIRSAVMEALFGLVPTQFYQYFS